MSGPRARGPLSPRRTNLDLSDQQNSCRLAQFPSRRLPALVHCRAPQRATSSRWGALIRLGGHLLAWQLVDARPAMIRLELAPPAIAVVSCDLPLAKPILPIATGQPGFRHTLGCFPHTRPALGPTRAPARSHGHGGRNPARCDAPSGGS